MLQDTTREARRAQLAAYRRMDPSQRVAKMSCMRYCATLAASACVRRRLRNHVNRCQSHGGMGGSRCGRVCALLSATPFFMRLVTGLRVPKEPTLDTDFAGQVEAVGSVEHSVGFVKHDGLQRIML